MLFLTIRALAWAEGKNGAEASSGKWEEGGVGGDPGRDPGFGTLEVSGHRGRASGEPREAERNTHRGTETGVGKRGTREELGEVGTRG